MFGSSKITVWYNGRWCLPFLLPSHILQSPPPQHASSDVERLLIGNKSDWEARRVVPKDRGEQLAHSQGIPFLETSAKTNHNIDEVRDHLMMSL